MSLTGWECYETPEETMTKIKHAIKLASTRVKDPMKELRMDELKPLVFIEDIRDDQCRWPLEQFNWCGRTTDGSVYCEVHHARAIQTPLPARSKSKHV